MLRISVFVILSLLMLQSCSEEIKVDTLSDSQSSALDILPANTQFLLYSNFKELRKTDFWENLLSESFKNDQQNNWLQEFEKETGYGFNKGVSEVFTSTTWGGINTFIISFDNHSGKLRDYFRNKKNFRTILIKGTEIFQPVENPSSFFYFKNDTLLIIINDVEYLNDLLAEKHKPLSSNSNFIGIVNNIRYKNHYWMATDKGSYAAILLEQIGGKNNIPQVRDLVKNINEITLSAHFGSGVDIESNWGCSDTKSAYLLSTALRSALALELFSDIDIALSKVLENTRIRRDERVVKISLALDEKAITKLRSLSKNIYMDKNL